VTARAAVVVLDACGVGALPDAVAYGDPAGVDTLAHVAEAVGGLDLPVLTRLGLGAIAPIAGVPTVPDPVVHGRLHPLGPGKESTTGHWELMGAVPPRPLPAYADGVPPHILARLESTTGHRFCCAQPYSGTEVIADWGEHHLRTGELIVYTSSDSVLQIAAHVDVLPEPGLLEVCRAVRAVMIGPDAIGRVIARPFAGGPGRFARTDGRRDFAIDPPGRTYLDELTADGIPVHAVGKVSDLFHGRGISVAHDGKTNAQALAATTELLADLDRGLIFTNLVETDQLYGHRHDVDGFAAALREIDAAIGRWLGLLRRGDLLVLTADHGVDPHSGHTDHTREHVPLLATFAGHGSERHDGPMADVGASVLRWLAGRDAPELPGTSFLGGARPAAD
jgi:phosphopentomutase